MGTNSISWALILPFALTSGFIWFLLRNHRLLNRWTLRRQDLNAVQAAHATPTPRIGGVAVVVSICICFILGSLEGFRTDALLAFILSFFPVFAAGLSEDLGYHVSPRGRLMAAACSSLMVIVTLGIWIPSSGLAGIDFLLGFSIIAIPFTILWTTGLCHAFNLIDGVNGLMAGVSTLIALALAVMAQQAGDQTVMTAALIVMAAISGFLVFNFPMGRIFMGDAGAYTIGHILAWLGISLAVRNDDIAGISVALLFFWPVADTLLAMFRRWSAGKRHDQPDRLHVHQLVMRGLEITYLGRARRHVANPLTTVVLLPFAGLPILTGMLLANHPLLSMAMLFLYGIAFFMAYRWGIEFVRESRKTFQLQKA
ncbi:MraY family glycosyltransferase [Rhodovulum adriaticum]|uniref:UDP-N-acetylmuramyl pentapeptide phosphotransferase/UDP-N-acetylglucosamine-1-phosphate transferase n=1 Tax=Rhodovulum adriaticum TaxID=35804 RepID=A0A4R2NGE5_RHOAD|nr:glycosyltransferase [Rhodovulum adriaticum]MBK1637249.1 hypothetical protein [Rhodovulum adriaticum]TCP20225.1 UDP-N-acetylmuramyl pentapeptide phosphotransferase/UDP-N-acetylglucosamine-1-phosphate transferase [Rhodovulum adriaticum]